MAQILKVRYTVQRYIGDGRWIANIDHKLCDWYGGNVFKTLDEARHQAKLAKRRRARYEAKPLRLRIITITTEIYEEL